jgi:O-antigen ligase
MAHTSTVKPPIADSPLFYSFLGLLIWAPLPMGSNRLWSLALLSIISLLLLSAWCALYLQQRVKTTRPLRKAWPFVGLLFFSTLWSGLQSIPALSLSLEPFQSQQQTLLSCGLLAFLSLSLALLNSQSRIKLTVYTLIACGLFQAAFGSLMTLSDTEYGFFIPKDSYTGVATGTFVNRNHLAGYLVICLSIGLGMMIATLKTTPSGNWRNRLRRWMTALLSKKILLRITLVMMVIGLVLTHSRMGNTSFFAGMMITGALALLLGRRASRSTIILLTSLLVIDVFIVGTFFGIEKVVDRLEQTTVTRESRDEVDLYSLEIFNQNLLTGTGTGTFYTAFPEVRQKDIRIFYDHAHNDYLEFITERGLIGFAPLLIAVILTFIIALKAQWMRKNPLMRGLSFGCLMSMIAMGLHATVDFNLQVPANAASFMLILAFGWISLYFKPQKQSSTLVNR